jgi:hypothetical protein
MSIEKTPITQITWIAIFSLLCCYLKRQKCKKVFIFSLSVVVAFFAFACQPSIEPAKTKPYSGSVPENSPTHISTEIESEVEISLEQNLSKEPEIVAFGYTYHRQDGNRLVSGRGALPDVEPVDIQLNGTPVWLVAAPFEDGSVWVAVLDDGSVEGYFVRDRIPEEVVITPDHLPPEMPPFLVVEGMAISLLTNPIDQASILTHPIPQKISRRGMWFIDINGFVRLWIGEEEAKAIPRAITDSRILSDVRGRLLYLSDATGIYDHGVLGDRVEAGGFALVDSNGGSEIITHVVLKPPSVIEGIFPMWADLDGDGEKEIIVTQSDASSGAQVMVYKEDGALRAVGDPIGLGYRWMHQLAVAPFGSNGEMELAVVRTPHIGGVLEFYQLSGDNLVSTATISGFSTHEIGSRNLDNALAGDFDGDGRVEILLPNQSHSSLLGVRRTVSGADLVWSLELTGVRTSNLAAVTLKDGRIEVGVGMDDSRIRLWLP